MKTVLPSPLSILLAVLPLGSLASASLWAQAPADTAVRECAFREVARERLTLDNGDLLYVEPRALVRSGERLLLAGTPNYRWTGDPPQLDSTGRNTLFGVVLEPDGKVRTVPSPVPAGLLRDVRALPREDGGWDVLFVETDTHFSPPDPELAVRVWHGVLHGDRWSALDSLPLSGQGSLQVSNTSALVRFGDTLAWAATVQADDGGRVDVFRRIGGRWEREAMRMRQPAYVRLFHTNTLGLAAVVLRPDVERGGQNNAMDLLARRDSWELVGQVVYAAREEMYEPWVDATRWGPSLSWWTPMKDGERPRLEARVLTGPVDGTAAPWVALDSAVSQVDQVRFRGADTWVVDHAFPGEPEHEFRFFRLAGGQPQRIGHGENPYTGYYAVEDQADAVLIAGPLLDETGSSPLLVSLLLRYAPSCGT